MNMHTCKVCKLYRPRKHNQCIQVIRAVIQKYLDMQHKWVDRNLMKFSKDKCEVVHLEKRNPVQQ